MSDHETSANQGPEDSGENSAQDNGGSIAESSDITNVAKTLFEQLTVEYNNRAEFVRQTLSSFHTDVFEDAGVLEDEFNDAVKKLLNDTEVACEKVRSVTGFDLSVFASYCNLAGIYRVALVFGESMRPPLRFEILNIQKVYMDHLSRGEVFEMDRASLVKIGRKIGRAVACPDDSGYDSDAPKPAPGTREYLASMAARKASAPYATKNPNSKKKPRFNPSVPHAGPPPKKPDTGGCVSQIQMSESSDSHTSSEEEPPKTPGKAVAKLPSLVERVMNTAAAKATGPGFPGSPKNNTQQFDLANLIACIPE
jgi:hypothetical protein